ncbi:polar amino acid ABC transporter, inner membrane subunit [Desulfotomaculum nigrificans CO-1-SRB]|uniref:Polar amino acid ABC transporter, inner membrane subunit n=1 Tax=Desulfotomaculum nigrificans (strain DSM 14880 / VKM B-2319 / CO-1-SRB) TaxID=868595 RepID=F6B9H5_DESCC|nr:amino acid ABC transporter permease [Desulfotomaculum nigrificans]AEF93751.1 polar amino acid ABC transporter, inner membrane subunit [Desulfotomaculum nigrificans CO-1-SRB]
MQLGPLDIAFILKILPTLLKGAVMTIKLTAFAIVFGTLIGLIVALAKISSIKILNWIGGLYTWVIRGVPLLLQLMFLYYGLAFAGIMLDEFTVAVLGLSVCGGAYIAEIIRAGILSIDRGQMEAALSMGMTYAQAMRRVILPQAYRRLLPPMGNEFITLMKDSALVSVITMTELLRSATQLQSVTFRPVEVYITAGLLYLIMTTFFTIVFDRLERKLAVSDGK